MSVLSIGASGNEMNSNLVNAIAGLARRAKNRCDWRAAFWRAEVVCQALLTPVKTTKPIAISSVVLLAALSARAQGFQNLNFEQANPAVDLSGPFYPENVTAASALPGWTAYYDNIQQSDIYQNVVSSGAVTVSIFGPNYPASGSIYGVGIIDGNYTAMLESGSFPNTLGQVSASIAQTGRIPPSTESLQFKMWSSLGPWSVTFKGVTLDPIVIGGGNGYVLYGADVSSFSGQTGSLEFNAFPPPNLGATYIGLDDITFSTQAIPEPTVGALTAIGGLLIGARKWLARRE